MQSNGKNIEQAYGGLNKTTNQGIHVWDSPTIPAESYVVDIPLNKQPVVSLKIGSYEAGSLTLVFLKVANPNRVNLSISTFIVLDELTVTRVVGDNVYTNIPPHWVKQTEDEEYFIGLRSAGGIQAALYPGGFWQITGNIPLNTTGDFHYVSAYSFNYALTQIDGNGKLFKAVGPGERTASYDLVTSYSGATGAGYWHVWNIALSKNPISNFYFKATSNGPVHFLYVKQVGDTLYKLDSTERTCVVGNNNYTDLPTTWVDQGDGATYLIGMDPDCLVSLTIPGTNATRGMYYGIGGLPTAGVTGYDISFQYDAAIAITFKTQKTVFLETFTEDKGYYVEESLAYHFDGHLNSRDGQNRISKTWDNLAKKSINGQLNGSTIWRNDGLEFNGVIGGTVNINGDIMPGTGDWTVEICGEFSTPPGTEQVLVGQSRTGDPATYTLISYHPANGFTWFQTGTGGAYTGTQLQAGKLFAYSVKRRGTRVTIQDRTGAVVATVSAPFNVVADVNTVIGALTNTLFFNGRLYSVRSYLRAIETWESSHNLNLDFERFGYTNESQMIVRLDGRRNTYNSGHLNDMTIWYNALDTGNDFSNESPTWTNDSKKIGPGSVVAGTSLAQMQTSVSFGWEVCGRILRTAGTNCLVGQQSGVDTSGIAANNSPAITIQGNNVYFNVTPVDPSHLNANPEVAQAPLNRNLGELVTIAGDYDAVLRVARLFIDGELVSTISNIDMVPYAPVPTTLTLGIWQLVDIAQLQMCSFRYFTSSQQASVYRKNANTDKTRFGGPWQQCSWIEDPGTCWIFTGVIPVENTNMQADMGVQAQNVQSYCGSSNTANDPAVDGCKLAMHTIDRERRYDYADRDNYASADLIPYFPWREIRKIGKGGYFVHGRKLGDPTSAWSGTSGKEIALFGYNATNFFKQTTVQRLYSTGLKIWTDNNTHTVLKPAIDSTDTVCVWDDVAGNYKFNQGSGAFTYGA